MENASKALLMAGSVLIALLILGALLLMFNNLSSYQKIGEQDTREAQVIEFNNQFTSYLRDDVRGSDIVSLMNRVVDYNTRKGNHTEGFKKMKIEITGIDVRNLLMYDKDQDEQIIKTQYNQDNINELLTIVKGLEDRYQAKYITALASNISKVMTSQEEAQKILPKNINTYPGGYPQIKKDTAKYYQYSQFKRLHFNCDTSATKYDTSSGRITELKFKATNKLN